MTGGVPGGRPRRDAPTRSLERLAPRRSRQLTTDHWPLTTSLPTSPFDISAPSTDDGLVELSSLDQDLQAGTHGPAAQMAMSIILRMAEFQRADRLLDITQAHIDSSIYMGEAGLEFAEKLAGLGASVRVPTTLNVSAVDEHNWQDWAVPREFAVASRRQMAAYEKMGCRPTWTCAPYQTELIPKFGEQIAWGESNAIVFANSVIGARTERYPDLMDICAAITGRVPAVGLHLSENRSGQVLMQLEGIPRQLQETDEFYPVLGHLMGKIARDKIPVISGLEPKPTEDQFKAMGAAGSASGTMALFHVIGHTPEARSMDEAFGGEGPRQIESITLDDLREARRELTTATGEALDMVILGSPHFSLAEFKQLSPLVAGKRRNAEVQFLVTSSRTMVELARAAGHLDPLEDFGGQVTVDTCILASPMLPPEIKILMTNSAKYAYYAPGLLDAEITFGSLADCVQSAVTGHVVRDGSSWE